MGTPTSLGLGNLALTVFTQSWRRDDETATEHLRRYVGVGGHAPHLDECADDARCLLASGLEPWELDRLWCWCSDGNHRPEREGQTGREWLVAVSAILAAYGTPRHEPHATDAALAARVRRVVDGFQPIDGYALPLCPMSTDEARRILGKLVDSGHAELAMRLFFTLANASFAPITRAWRDEIAAVSHDLGHPDHFIEEIDVP